MNEYIFTDLAYEAFPLDQKDRTASEEKSDRVRVLRLSIADEYEERRYGKAKGNYVTVLCDPLWHMGEEELSIVRETVVCELRRMMQPFVCAKKIRDPFSVMVVGLGNEDMTADALGPCTAKQITVRGHTENDRFAISSIVPGVVGNTGIETAEIVKGTVDRIRADLVIAVDALAAKSYERLAATVQLSDSGITPGSGMGSGRCAINRQVLGIPVIAIGVPMVMHASTLMAETVRVLGISELSDPLRAFLQGGRSFFVIPKEGDFIRTRVSLLLASAIDEACTEWE